MAARNESPAQAEGKQNPYNQMKEEFAKKYGVEVKKTCNFISFHKKLRTQSLQWFRYLLKKDALIKK